MRIIVDGEHYRGFHILQYYLLCRFVFVSTLIPSFSLPCRILLSPLREMAAKVVAKKIIEVTFSCSVYYY